MFSLIAPNRFLKIFISLVVLGLSCDMKDL